MNKTAKAGFTLVEILVAALLLAVLAVGGAAVLAHTGENIQRAGNRRIATELANQRLETARMQKYYGQDGLRPDILDLDDNFFLIDEDGDNALELIEEREPDQISIGGKTYSMFTKIVRWSDDASPYFNSEYLDITVSVFYRQDTPEKVTVRTLLLPPKVTQ